MDFRWNIIQGYAPLLIKGFCMTLQEVAALGIVPGTLRGLLAAKLEKQYSVPARH